MNRFWYRQSNLSASEHDALYKIAVVQMNATLKAGSLRGAAEFTIRAQTGAATLLSTLGAKDAAELVSRDLTLWCRC